LKIGCPFVKGMKEKIIDTERLVLRKFTVEDSAFIIQLLNTEGWLKYIGDRHIKTTEQAREYLLNGPMKSYEENGFGLALVQLKSNHQPIGMCGLIKRNYLEYPDLGFAFLPEYTRLGYALEIATAVIDHAFHELDKKEILAITLPHNDSSIRLLKKIGFVYKNNFITVDTKEELSLYSISSTG